MLLNDNQISTLGPYKKLKDLLPSLINLGLENNLISGLSELRNLQSLNLKGLILVNNPIRSKFDTPVYLKYKQFQILFLFNLIN